MTIMAETKVFKKTSPNGKLTMYLGSREFSPSADEPALIDCVIVPHPDYTASGKRVIGQLSLTFRYGREDEEVMGIQFSTDAVLDSKIVYPVQEKNKYTPTPFQQLLMKKLGSAAIPAFFEINQQAPLSVHLNPAKRYEGAPIGISYDAKAFVLDREQSHPHRRSTVRMGIRMTRYASPASGLIPHAATEKAFLLSEGKITMEATLEKDVYQRGESVAVNVTIHNNSSKSIRKLQIAVVQFTDVTMFSNGKFKNTVGIVDTKERLPVLPGATFIHSYTISLEMSKTKRWIAVEDVTKQDKREKLSCTITKRDNEDKNIFSIYISYYIKLKAFVSGMGGELCVKLPFSLLDPAPSAAPVQEPSLSNSMDKCNISNNFMELNSPEQAEDIDEDAFKHIFEDFLPIASA